MQRYNAATSTRIPAAVAMRGAAIPPPRAQPAVSSTRQMFDPGEEIIAEGETCRTFYKVISGTVRTGKLLPDGRRQIDAFHVQGDIFGVESGECHRLGAEAVDRVVVAAYRRSGFFALVQADPALREELMSAMLSSLDRAHGHMMLLGRKTASERMATFLLDLSERQGHGDWVDLPMRRIDIADYLGLTIETVSRTLSQMVREGKIRLTSARTIVFKRKGELRHLDA